MIAIKPLSSCPRIRQWWTKSPTSIPRKSILSLTLANGPAPLQSETPIGSRNGPWSPGASNPLSLEHALLRKRDEALADWRAACPLQTIVTYNWF
jgi:hypothetical protein